MNIQIYSDRLIKSASDTIRLVAVGLFVGAILDNEPFGACMVCGVAFYCAHCGLIYFERGGKDE